MFLEFAFSVLLSYFGPNPPLVVSEETTVITAPLSDDGLPDYQTYWRDLGREGVTHDNNGAVPFWKAIWPTGLSQNDWLAMSDALGFAQMPSTTESLQDPFDKTVRSLVSYWLTTQYQAGLTPTESDVLLNPTNQQIIDNSAEEVIDLAMSRPWTSEQIPPLADWVKHNAKPFELLTEASQRPMWWSPSPSLLRPKYEGAIQILLPAVQNLRGATRALCIRAMWYAAQGQRAEAWQDLQTTFQLATHCGRGMTLVEQLVAIAIDNTALSRTVTLLQLDESDAKFAREVLDYLQKRKIPSDVVRSFDQGERVFFADMVVMLQRDFSTLENAGTDVTTPALLFYSQAPMNWNDVLRSANAIYNRLVETASIPDRAERMRATSNLDHHISQLARSAGDPARIVASFINAEVRSALVADTMVSLMLPALNASMKAQDRAIAVLDLTRVAAALAVYRAEQGEYPEKLAQLVPSVLDKVPNDLYSDKPFSYERKPDGGYLLYSVFEDGKDDGGTDRDGSIIGGEWVTPNSGNVDYEHSDLVIRVPVPKFELPPKPTFVN